MIKKIRNILNDPDVDFQTKSFVLFASITLIGLILAMISGILLGQALSANVFVFIQVCFSTVIFAWALYRNAIKKAMVIVAAFLVFLFMPATFFTSGGAAGGTPVWIAFSTLYIVLTLSGKPKAFFLCADAVVVSVCWWIGYTRPETVVDFTRKQAYYDSYFTLLIVGTVMALLIGYQAILFRRENDRVNSQKKEIEELNRSQTRFYSSMSHEIRTPINSILGLNEVILRQEDASDEIRADAADIQGAGKLLLALINDLLDFSKIEAGKMDIIPVDYRVGDMMSEIVNMIWLRAKEKGLDFHVDIAPDVPSSLCGDEIRISQVIINLLSNAIKYTETGSVRLGIWSERTVEDHVNLKISVADTGMGIKEEALPTLFDAFARLDQERNRNIVGTGLGLSIVKQLVELMDGKVDVDSVYGKGTTFTVTLPQKITDATPIGKREIRKHQAKHSTYKSLFTAPDACILIVDDSKMNLTVETKLLRDTHMTVETATSGAQALEMTLAKRYDVILMDHIMPGMDGIECLKHMRSQPGGACTDAPIIALTANAGVENQQLYDSAGFDGCLVKPILGEKLEEALIEFLPKDKIIMNDTKQEA